MESQSVEISSHPIKGNVVIANSAIKHGMTILRERAVAIVPTNFQNSHTVSYAIKFPCIDHNLWAQYFYFKSESIVTQEKILSFFCPVDSDWTISLREALGLETLSGNADIDAEEFLKVVSTFKFNAISVNPAPSNGSSEQAVAVGVGLFTMSCRISHSCNPNCFWFSDENGLRVVRSTRSIIFGEEITVDYYSERNTLQPTFLRRQTLQLGYEFYCSCERCEESGDRTRQFSCATESCPGVYFVKQATLMSRPEFLSCSLCSHNPSSTLQQKFLEDEVNLQIALDEFDLETECGGAIDATTIRSVLELNPLSPLHSLTFKLCKAKGDIYSSSSSFKNVESAVGQRLAAISALEASVVEPSRFLAFELESLGNFYSGLSSPGDSLKAKEFYQRALRNLRIVGDDNCPYTVCTSKLLLREIGKIEDALRGLKQRPDNSTEKSTCTFCGVTGDADVTSIKLLVCSSSRETPYCSFFCQKIHWKLHKKFCRSP